MGWTIIKSTWSPSVVPNQGGELAVFTSRRSLKGQIGLLGKVSSTLGIPGWCAGGEVAHCLPHWASAFRLSTAAELRQSARAFQQAIKSRMFSVIYKQAH